MLALKKIFGEIVQLPTALARAAFRVENDPALKAFRMYMRKMRVSAGTELFRKGETAEMLYLVLDGTARRVDDDILVSSGALIGGQSILSGDPTAAATVRAESDLTVLALPMRAARALCVAEPEFGYLVAQRLFQSNATLSSRRRAQAAIPPAIAA